MPAQYKQHASAKPTLNDLSRKPYDGSELKPYDGRPGCNQSLGFPSRVGDSLRYRDGTVRKITQAS